MTSQLDGTGVPSERNYLKRSGVLLPDSHEEPEMLRRILGFALLAVIAVFMLKLVFGLLGIFLGLLGAVLWLAFLGFVIYMILKIFAPGTAARVREMIAG